MLNFRLPFQRERKSSWPLCIATWRSMGRCTMRRSVPQKCLPLSRTTACCLSTSCSSSSGGPRWEDHYWGVHEFRFYIKNKYGSKWEILSKVLILLKSWSVHLGMSSPVYKLMISSFFFFPVKLFIGFGFPYEGPAPLEAIANGCIFLQPKFNPPHSSLNHEFFRGKPTSRKVRCTLSLFFFILASTLIFYLYQHFQ